MKLRYKILISFFAPLLIVIPMGFVSDSILGGSTECRGIRDTLNCSSDVQIISRQIFQFVGISLIQIAIFGPIVMFFQHRLSKMNFLVLLIPFLSFVFSSTMMVIVQNGRTDCSTGMWNVFDIDCMTETEVVIVNWLFAVNLFSLVATFIFPLVGFVQMRDDKFHMFP
jgi:hypothetical protein